MINLNQIHLASIPARLTTTILINTFSKTITIVMIYLVLATQLIISEPFSTCLPVLYHRTFHLCPAWNACPCNSLMFRPYPFSQSPSQFRFYPCLSGTELSETLHPRTNSACPSPYLLILSNLLTPNKMQNTCLRL